MTYIVNKNCCPLHLVLEGVAEWAREHFPDIRITVEHFPLNHVLRFYKPGYNPFDIQFTEDGFKVGNEMWQQRWSNVLFLYSHPKFFDKLKIHIDDLAAMRFR